MRPGNEALNEHGSFLNSLHAKIIYTSLFINAEIKFISQVKVLSVALQALEFASDLICIDSV